MKRVCNALFALMISCAFSLSASAAKIFEVPVANSVALSTSCANLLLPDQAIVSTLKDLYERHVLTMPDLVAIRHGKNPFEFKRSVDAIMFKSTIENIIDQLNASPDAQTRVDSLIRKMNVQYGEQMNQVAATKELLLPIRFYDYRYDKAFRVPGGSGVAPFFRFANIPVTQWIYAEVTGVNPSHFASGPGSIKIDINGDSVSMRPNNPVESVSLMDQYEFIQKLNEWSRVDDPRIYRVLPNHVRHYEIRLPTQSEWQYVATNLGRSASEFPNLEGINSTNMKHYAWFSNNSGGTTHPVMELSPLMVGGHPIFDLLGNVYEQVDDNDREDLPPIPERVRMWNSGGRGGRQVLWLTVGGSYHTVDINLTASSTRASNGDSHIGFRIIEVPR